MIMTLMWAILAAFWITLLANSATAGSALAIRLWIVAACLALFAQGRWQSAAIANGARVLGQLRTPQHLWRGWLRGSLAGSMRAWVILAVGAGVLLMQSQSAWQWTIGAVELFSAVLSLSTLAALSNHGVLPRAWAWAITAGGGLLTLFTAMGNGFESVPEQFGQVPFVLQGLLAVSWPLLAYILVTVWQHQASMALTSHGGASKGLGSRISAYARRYTVLTNAAGKQSSDTRLQMSPSFRLFQALIPSFYISGVAIQWLAVPSHGNIGPYHLLGFGFVVVFSTTSLVCKDLHWRQLLAPGGLHRGRLGWRILRATVALQIAVFLLLASLWIVVSWAAFDVPLARNLETAWKYRVFPLEWLLATSLAVVLRAAGAASIRDSLVIYTAWVAALLLFAGGLFWAFGFSQGPTLFSVDPSYLSGLLVATVALVLLSNRLWTVKKLLPFLRWH